MLRYNYSQLPVMTTEREVKGMISWKSTSCNLAIANASESVRDCMENAKETPASTPLLDAVSVIAEHDYVLVRGVDSLITGIVTASDLSLQFMQLAEPFLLIGEIERYLRRLVHGKFTVEELNRTTDDQQPIEGIGNLTLGHYVRLVGDKGYWKKLNLNISRKEFIKYLEEVREIRNEVMHFNLDGPPESDMEKLRGTACFLASLD